MDVINTKNGKTIMTKEKAKLIADSFLDDMNPDLWNDEGNKPKSFNEMIWDYPISDTVNLEVTFGYEVLLPNRADMELILRKISPIQY